MNRTARILFKILDVIMIFMLTFGAPMTVLADPSPTGATITTELPDYPPGAVVLMTGAGWAPLESVHITVNDNGGNTWSLESNPDPVADEYGGFTYQFTLPDWFVAVYDVTATGFTSGTATVSFTDLAIGTYDQCSNDDGDGYAGGGDTGCRWINGNLQRNNSVYFEGDATVQRLWLTDLVPGSTHTVTFKYGTTKGGKHAYDFLTSWNWSENWISVADRCQDITGCDTASESATPIPADPNANGFDVAANLIQSRRFTMRGGTLNSASTPSLFSGTYAGDSETVITVNFTVGPANGSMCSTRQGVTTCGIAIWFGAHVAAQANWGLGNGAGSISGSPYHVALDAVDGASAGQRDNQMQADAVTFYPNGTIIIIKDAQPNDAQDFSFSLSSSTIIQNFSLDDDSDGTLPNTTAPQYSVPPGTYTAKELNIPSGWSLAGLTCSVSGSSGSTFTTDLGTGTATINLVSLANTATGDTVTCTFVDTRNVGSLKLTKSLTGGPQGYTGPFTINYDCDGTAYDGSVQVNAGSSQTVSGIPSGTSCTISETLPSAPAGYTFGTPSFSPSDTVIIASGTTVEVTTNNTLTLNTGSLKLNKSLSGGPDGYTGPFTINYDCDGTAYDGSVQVSAGGSQTINGIPTGTSCTISETLPNPPAGYSFGSPSFSPSDTVTIGHNTTVEVTTNNTLTRDLGSLRILKTLSNPDGAPVPASFAVDYDCGAGYTGQVNVAPGSPATVNGIPTGNTCTVTEVAPAAIPGYTWGTVTYTPNSVTIDTNGGTFEITVGNSITRDRGSLKILKTLSNPDGAPVPASFAVDYDCGAGYTGQVNVAPGGSSTVSGIPTGSTCTVTEVAPAAIPGYTWGTVTYTPNSVTIDSNGGTFEITVGNSISRDMGYFKIEKVFDAQDSGFTGDFDIVYNCGAGDVTVQLGAGESQTFGPFPTGTSCTVSEPTLPTPPADWVFGSPSVSGSPVEIVKGDAAAAQLVTVTNSIIHLEADISVTKQSSDSDVCIGSDTTVTYTYVVTNTGDVALTGTLVDDNGTPGAGDDVTVGTFTNLAPGASQTFTSDFTVNGTTTNTVTATGTSAGGQTAQDTAHATVTGHDCTITVTKEPSATNVCAGGAVTYTYRVTNNSDLFSWSGSLEDDQLGTVDASITLGPGASETFAVSTSITGTVTNVATASGTFDDDDATSASDSAQATVTSHNCTVTVTKSPSARDVCDGGAVTYTYTVTNNSDFFTWTGTLTDDQLGQINGAITLGPGQSTGPLTASTNITGTVTNVATASGTFDDDSATSAGDSASATVTSHDCTITVTKTPSARNVCDGGAVTYTYTVTNNSDLFTWTGTLTDDRLGQINGAIALEPGESTTLTASANITGTVTNTATASGTFDDDSTTSASDSASATVTSYDCSISITKSPSTANVCAGSDTEVTYTITVTNNSDQFDWTGDVEDDVLGILATGVTIAAGESVTYTPAHVVNATTTNTVTASGAFDDSNSTSASDTASATVTSRDCTISVTKTPSTDNVCNGSNTQVTYTYVVTNNSNYYSVSGTVTDDQLGTIGNFGPLAPGASATLTKAAAVNGTVTNVATATGTFNDTDSTSDSDTATATVTGHNCAISITKTAGTDNVCNGSNTQVTYTYVVTNNSDFFNASGSVVDDNGTPGNLADDVSVGNFGPLAPGASATLTKVFIVNGTVTNTGTANATFNDVDTTVDTDSASATVTGHTCTISITKTPSTANVCNGSNTQVTYTYVVTNTGDYFNVSGSVTDNQLGSIGNFGPLAPGASATLTKVATINGTTTNTATATGTFNDAGSTSATASATATVTGRNCTISITKTPSVSQVCNSTNTQVTYTYVVTNNSNYYSVSGSVTDNQLGAIGTFTDLAPGASQTFTKAATINATTNNTATASGTFNDGTNTSATASASATVTGVPCQIIVKKIVKPTTSATSFSFDANGTGYVDFSLSDQQTNTQNLLPGTYTVKELVPLGWALTGIGGSTDPTTPYNCTVSGSGGSTGVGDLNTQTATITLRMGDVVTCVFENTGQGATRTQGFWATHAALANIAWFGGTAYGHTFPGVAATAGIGDASICGRPIDTLGKLMGGFWSDISKKSTRASRSSLDQARMQLLQQLLAAELNASAFGSVPSGGTAMFAQWESALCGTSQSAITTAKQQAASFNTFGDSATFTPGTSADSRYGRSIANIPFWDIIKP